MSASIKRIDLGQMIQILANVGVIAGIVFLAVEVRQNNALLRNQARYYHMDNAVQGMKNRATDEDLMSIRIKYLNDEILTEAEYLQLSAEAAWVLITWQWEYEQFEKGYLDKVPVADYRLHVERYPYLIDEFERRHDGSGTSSFERFMREQVLAGL